MRKPILGICCLGILLYSCHPKDEVEPACRINSGGVYRAATAEFNEELQIFTAAGLVTNDTARKQFLAAHPGFYTPPFTQSQIADTLRFVSVSTAEFTSGAGSPFHFNAGCKNSKVLLSATDTIRTGGGSNWIDTLFEEKDYKKFVAIPPSTGFSSYYKTLPVFQLEYRSGDYYLPYTALYRIDATGWLFSYFSKTVISPLPLVPGTGDTIAFQRGYRVYRPVTL